MSEMLDLVAAAIDDHMSFNDTYTALELATVAVGIIERCEGWQPIETAPRDGTAVLLWDTFSVFEGFNNSSFDGTRRHDCWCTANLSPRPHTTHWQPLPAPPLPTEAPTASATGRAADHSGVAGLESGS